MPRFVQPTVLQHFTLGGYAQAASHSADPSPSGKVNVMIGTAAEAGKFYVRSMRLNGVLLYRM
jgi:hypothetical protein